MNRTNGPGPCSHLPSGYPEQSASLARPRFLRAERATGLLRLHNEATGVRRRRCDGIASLRERPVPCRVGEPLWAKGGSTAPGENPGRGAGGDGPGVCTHYTHACEKGGDGEGYSNTEAFILDFFSCKPPPLTLYFGFIKLGILKACFVFFNPSAVLNLFQDECCFHSHHWFRACISGLCCIFTIFSTY